MAIKKTKNKKSFFIYNIKTLDDKRERHLKEGKFGLKASFKKKKKSAFYQTLQIIRISERETRFRYMITQT